MTDIPSRPITALAHRHRTERRLTAGGMAKAVHPPVLQRRPHGEVESPGIARRMGVER